MTTRPTEGAPSRVTIDTEAAWIKIRQDIDANMKGIMDARLATLPLGPDGQVDKALRAEVESRLGQIRDRTFDLAKANLRVNGFDYETYVPATEPFDEALDMKTWGLESQRVETETQLAQMKNKIPGQIREREENLEMRRAQVEWLPEGDDDEDARPKAQLPPPPRHDQVKQIFNTAVSNMSEVATTAPGLVQRAQRANHVRDELSNLSR